MCGLLIGRTVGGRSQLDGTETSHAVGDVPVRLDALRSRTEERELDAVLTAVLQAAPELSVGVLLLVFIWILLRREARLDRSHRDALDAQARLHTAELKRVNEAHDVELRELNGKIRDLRRDLDALDRQLSAERAARLGLRGVDAVDLDLDACTVTLRYADGTREVRDVTGCGDS